MRIFKTIAFLLLSSMLAFSACSKDKADNAKQRPAKTVASKTVDLGEADEADQDKAKDKADRQRNKPNRQRDDRRRGGPRDKANRAAKDAPDDTAAKAAPEAPKADNAVAEAEKVAPEVKADEAPAPEVAEGLDFANDDATAPEAAPTPKAAPEPTPRIVNKRQGLDIENLINIKEVREQTGFAGVLEQTDLIGQPSDSRYNVIRLSTDKASELGFALQVWKPGNESAASKRFDEMFKQSFGGVKQKDVATDAFIASHHNISELAFYDKSKRAVVMISCSDSICKKDSLKSIAAMLQRRL